MLILAREINRSIILKYPSGEKVTVVVLGINGAQIKIGIDAPKDFNIVRSELLED